MRAHKKFSHTIVRMSQYCLHQTKQRIKEVTLGFEIKDASWKQETRSQKHH